MMRVAIIEDEVDAQSLLSSILSEYCPGTEVVGISGSIQSGIDLIKNEKPELVFLDIEIEGGQSFDLLDQIDYSNLKIIFTTAYDHFALDAFKYGAIDYLLKPYSPRDVFKSLERVKKFQYDSAIFNRLDYLIKQNNHKDKINVPTSEGISIVAVNDIIRVEADRSYCYVYLSSGERLMVSKPLKDIEIQLDKNVFIRVHATHLINTDYINKYVKEDGGYLVMNDGCQIPISRRRKQEFLDFINQ